MATHRTRRWGARILAGMLLAATTVLSGCFYHHGHYGSHRASRGGWYAYDHDHHGGDRRWDDRDRDRRGDRDRDHRRDRDRDRRHR